MKPRFVIPNPPPYEVDDLRADFRRFHQPDADARALRRWRLAVGWAVFAVGLAAGFLLGYWRAG